MNKSNITTAIPVVLLLSSLFIWGLVRDESEGVSEPSRTVEAVFGGPKALAFTGDIFDREAAVENFYPIDALGDAGVIAESGYLATAEALLVNPSRPEGNLMAGRNGLLIYKVQPGETLSGIAANFEISLNTVLWANPGLRSRYLSPGQEVVILPTSGVLHEMREGETLDSVAKLYGVPEEHLLAFNSSQLKELLPGRKIIVPGGKPLSNLNSGSRNNLPSLTGYFSLPTTGWNWGELHEDNAIDIANACGTSIYAAQEGLVIKVGDPGNWNLGYGGFVEIEHPNKTGTKYAHTGKNFVSVGDYVEKKQLIAEMGNTGNVHGVSGCHLHFEVAGAKNPLAK